MFWALGLTEIYYLFLYIKQPQVKNDDFFK